MLCVRVCKSSLGAFIVSVLAVSEERKRELRAVAFFFYPKKGKKGRKHRRRSPMGRGDLSRARLMRELSLSRLALKMLGGGLRQQSSKEGEKKNGASVFFFFLLSFFSFLPLLLLLPLTTAAARGEKSKKINASSGFRTHASHETGVFALRGGRQAQTERLETGCRSDFIFFDVGK